MDVAKFCLWWAGFLRQSVVCWLLDKSLINSYIIKYNYTRVLPIIIFVIIVIRENVRFFDPLDLGNFFKCFLVSAHFGELGMKKQQSGIKEK